MNQKQTSQTQQDETVLHLPVWQTLSVGFVATLLGLFVVFVARHSKGMVPALLLATALALVYTAHVAVEHGLPWLSRHLPKHWSMRRRKRVLLLTLAVSLFLVTILGSQVPHTA